MSHVYSVEIDNVLASSQINVRIRKPTMFEGRLINFTISSSYSDEYPLWVVVIHLISLFQNELDQLL